LSKYVGSKFVSKEDGSLPVGTDWLNRISTSELTANRKQGGGKRKWVEESDDKIMLLKKKRRAGR
jgi:transposase